MSGRSQTIGNFTVSRPSQISPTNENSKLRYPRSSGIVGDKAGISRAFLFSRRVSDFTDFSAMVGDHSRQMKTKIVTAGDVGGGFRSLPSSKLLGSSPPITNFGTMSIFDPLSISRQIQYWENLGQTSSDYPTVGKK